MADRVGEEPIYAPHILSIQSSVVTGYVGNRAATFPLQLLGFNVSCLNTVQFSTHTGYPAIRGGKLTREEIETLFTGIVENGAASEVVALLTGYVPGAEGVSAVQSIAQTLLGWRAETLWVLDPVMGDEERGLYVSSEVPALYRSLIAQATIITPNQFELEVLAEVPVVTLQDVCHACDALHARGVRNIVVTTFRDPEDRDFIKIVASSRKTDGHNDRFLVRVPYHPRPYQGTGDLFAALLTANYFRKRSLRQAVPAVLDAMAPVLARTGRRFDAVIKDRDWRAEKTPGADKVKHAEICRACELCIIESAADIMSPAKLYSVEDL